MTITFYILAAFVVISAVAALNLRNLVHCALALALTFIGLAALYLQLDAQFVGLVQILVYVGAVAILIVFAILLTRSGDTREAVRPSLNWLVGIGIAALVFGVIALCIVSTGLLGEVQTKSPEITVRAIGNELMTRYVLPLEVIALLLTAALIGAVLIALQEKSKRKEEVRKS
jgi:NADH-quinone oxidoreductase subunit J